MARKTAMKKEPTVSVALPNSEKKRLGMPTTPDRQKPQRLSPGVYRGPKGQLQTSSGRQLPRPATPPGQAGRLVDAMNQAPQQGQIATRPPAPLGTPAGSAQQDGQGSAPIGNMMGQMPQMPQLDMSQFNRRPQQQQRPNSITGLLQQGGQQQQPMQPPMTYGQGEVAYTGGSPNFYNSGQQQQPMMQNPQMNMPMPELSFEQWKQMQMGQQMPQQGIVAPQQQITPQGQMSPAELQAMRNGTFKGYAY